MLLSAKTGRVRETTPLRRLSHKFEEMKNRVIIHRLRYVELINLLGNEFTLKEASNILNRPQRTLYGWVQTLRPIFKEYMKTVDYI